jgi:hypothetical protein
MSYTPQNIYVFLAAFDGVQSGILGSSSLTSANPDDYATVDGVCGAFAEAIDTAWASESNPSLYQKDAIEELCKTYWIGNTIPKAPDNTLVATFTEAAEIILAIVQSGVNWLTGQGITSPAYPPASTGVTSVGATAPIHSSGGASPVVSITAATDVAAGSLSAADKTKLDALTVPNSVALATPPGVTVLAGQFLPIMIVTLTPTVTGIVEISGALGPGGANGWSTMTLWLAWTTHGSGFVSGFSLLDLSQGPATPSIDSVGLGGVISHLTLGQAYDFAVMVEPAGGNYSTSGAPNAGGGIYVREVGTGL